MADIIRAIQSHPWRPVSRCSAC